MPNYRLQIVIEQDEDGVYVAECPALQGCYSQGDTFEEALEHVRDVIQMCLREAEDEGRVIETRYPEVIGIKTLDIEFESKSA